MHTQKYCKTVPIFFTNKKKYNQYEDYKSIEYQVMYQLKVVYLSGEQANALAQNAYVKIFGNKFYGR